MYKYVLILCLICVLTLGQIVNINEFDDSDDFSEFDEDASEIEYTTKSSRMDYVTPKVNIKENIPGDVDETDDFEDGEDVEIESTTITKNKIEREITINEIPISLRMKWSNFWLEGILLGGLVVFLLNFIINRETNSKIAKTWFNVHKSILETHFHVMTENGMTRNFEANGSTANDNNNSQDFMTCESENFYSLWCSGRICCEGMLIELKLLKRQDLISWFVGYLMRIRRDKIRIKVFMKKEDMDNFIVCLAVKKTANVFAKKMADLMSFGIERKPGEKFNIPDNFNVFSEISEVTSSIFDSKVVSTIHRFKDCIDFIHISDQYSGFKNTEESSTQNLQLPETEKILIFEFNLPIFANSQSVLSTIESIKPLMLLVSHIVDKIRKFRLSKDARTKSEKNRARIEQEFLKSTHAARAEAAAARREEKRRQERERIMADLDLERQRKWEEKDQKRQMKKRAPKMRLFKIKSV